MEYGIALIGLLLLCGLLYQHNKKIDELFLGINKYNSKLIKEKKGKIKFKRGYEKTEHPIIPIILKEHIYYVLLDTGANNNIIDYTLLKAIYKEDNLEVESTEPINCGTNSFNNVHKVKLDFQIETDIYFQKCTEYFSILDIKPTLDVISNKYEREIIGILGTKFFNDNHFRIDFDNYLITINK